MLYPVDSADTLLPLADFWTTTISPASRCAASVRWHVTIPDPSASEPGTTRQISLNFREFVLPIDAEDSAG